MDNSLFFYEPSFDSLFGRSSDFFKTNPNGCFCGLDITEKKDSYSVAVDLPGLKKEEINVTIKDNVLRIQAERKKEEKGEDEKRKWEERYHGKIHRSVKLCSNCDTENIKSTFENGVLTLEFNKKEVKDTTKKITL